MSETTVDEYAIQISALLQERLRIKGRSLSRQLGKVGRRMPKKVKRAAVRVDQARGLAAHPKLARQIDLPQIAEDAQQVISHLKGIDPTEVLKDKVLLTLGKISAVLIILFIGSVWYAHSRGLI